MDQDTDAIIGTLKDAIGDVLEEARKVPPVQTQNPTQHVVIHSAEPPKAEPKMAWICATSAIVMLFVTVIMAMLYVDLSRKYDRMQDHLSAIYMMAPQLKPKE